MQLIGVPSIHIDKHWNSVVELIRSACNRSGNRYTVESTKNLIASRDWQLWLVMCRDEVKAAVVTCIHTYPSGLKACAITLCAGNDAPAWVDMVIRELSTWSEKLGCELLEATARSGWLRRCPGSGFKKIALLEKEI